MPINLDDMSADELWEFGMSYQHPTRKEAKELVGHRPRYTVIAEYVGHYAINASVAKRLRLKGQIRDALIYESIADRIYKDFPADIQW
jgi:hypothetical protein